VCVTTITRARGPVDGGGFVGGVGDVGDDSSPEHADAVSVIARMIAARAVNVRIRE
jgi:hypothetical protein